MHYKVIVLGEHVDSLLAPYDENLRTEPRFYRTWEEVRKYNNDTVFFVPVTLNEQEEQEFEETANDSKARFEYVRKKNEEYEKNGINRTLQYVPLFAVLDKSKKQNTSTPIFAFMKAKGEEMTDSTLRKMLEETNEYIFDEQNNELTTSNPKGKWDWYSLGGRFDFLPLKEDVSEEKDIFTIEDIEWMRSKEELEEEKNFWNDYVLNQHPEKYEDDFLLYKREYYLNKYKNLETYLEANKYDTGYAIVTPDGEWHEPGRMGYFCSTASAEDELDFELHAYKKWIAPLPKDTPVWLVDCHT